METQNQKTFNDLDDLDLDMSSFSQPDMINLLAFCQKSYKIVQKRLVRNGQDRSNFDFNLIQAEEGLIASNKNNIQRTKNKLAQHFEISDPDSIPDYVVRFLIALSVIYR